MGNATRDPFKPDAVDWLRDHWYAIPIAIILIVVTTVIGYGRYRDNATPEQTAETIPVAPSPTATTVPTAAASSDGSLRIPDDQLAIISAAHASLVEIAKKSKKAAELLAFYDAYGLPAIRVDAERMQYATTPTTPMWFLVIANPAKLAGLEDNLAHVAAQFSCQPPAMILRKIDLTAFLQGILLAHELSHATDCLVNHEPPSNYPDPVWLLGEGNAHAAVFQVLTEYTGGKWKDLVTASRARREAFAVSQGGHPEAMVFNATPGDQDAVTSMFGELDTVSMGTLLSQLTVDVNMENVSVQSKRYGLTEEQELGHRVEFFQKFYETNGASKELLR